MGLTSTGIFIIGVLCGIALAFLAPLIWRRLAPLSAQRRLTGVAAAALLAVVSAVTFFTLGVRHGAPQPQATVSAARPAAPTAAAKSMEAEVASLEARLAREGGSEADWSLLERAYEILGRPQDAQRAHAHVANPAAAPAPPMSAATLSAAAASLGAGANSAAPATTPAPGAPAAPSTSDLERAVQANPRDTASWLALAEARRSLHDYQGARDALDRVIGLRGMTAQAWADYADVSASLAGGSLAGTAGTAIDNALALDPANAKALWLKASQAHEQHRYREALSWWQKLRAALPPDSADLRIIDSNIAEDQALATGTAAVAAAPATNGGAAELSGEVTLDQRFAGRVVNGTTMFIYAKAADSPGPPLAVMRTVAGSWPVRFRLDDSMAMLPTRRISQFNNVVVEARISRTGQATPSSGDLYATSAVLHPGTKKLVLVIDHEIS